MNITEAQTILAVLTAAYWTGRAMPEATAKLYAQHFADLEFEDTMIVVQDFIDNDSGGYFPLVGQIRDRYKSRRMYRQPLRELSSGQRGKRGAPWFIRLQAHRQKNALAAGFPLNELAEGHEDDLRAECEAAGIDTSELTIWIANHGIRV